MAANQQATKVDSSGTEAFANGGPVTGLYVATAGTAGSVQLKDGGSGGDVLLDVPTPAAATGVMIPVPGGEIPFGSSVYVEFSNVEGITVFRRAD